MSLDGISLSTLGLYQPVTPSEVANRAEKSSQELADKVIKEVENAEKLKLNPEGSNKQQEKEASKQKKSKEITEVEEDIFEENRLNQYVVKFNSSTNLVELVDKTTQAVIETIKPEDLISLMSKSKTHFGILVDREV
jgi:uncharacterized FlaG/YvyC family protein